MKLSFPVSWAGLLSILPLMFCAVTQPVAGSENEARRPFAQWAEVPGEKQFLFGTLYEQSEAYHVWEQGNVRRNVNHRVKGEDYGIDVKQGYFTFDYGLTPKWAADLNIGATTVGWRAFNKGQIGKTTGIMDPTFGVRYQIFKEAEEKSRWIPTLTFRAGAVLPGTYNRHVGFAPGNHGVAIEPSLLFRKHVGWEGFGVWGDVLYRWEHSIGADQYITAFGLFQQIKNWELDVGYRHLQTLSGENIRLGPSTGSGIYDSANNAGSDWYSADVREISDSIDAGFSYTTRKRHIRVGFHARKTFDGSNTDSALWLGAFLDIPFGLAKSN